MPFSLIFALMEFGLSQILTVLGIGTLLASAAGFFYYKFQLQKNEVRDDATKKRADAAKEWRDVADAHAEKIAILDKSVAAWKKLHETCEENINDLTQFNLRLQARERSYQRTINRLEIRLKIEPTDWNDVTDAPSFDSRR
jgi:hypothetical protein